MTHARLNRRGLQLHQDYLHFPRYAQPRKVTVAVIPFEGTINPLSLSLISPPTPTTNAPHTSLSARVKLYTGLQCSNIVSDTTSRFLSQHSRISHQPFILRLRNANSQSKHSQSLDFTLSMQRTRAVYT